MGKCYYFCYVDTKKMYVEYPAGIEAVSPVCARHQYVNMLRDFGVVVDMSRIFMSVVSTKVEQYDEERV